MFRSSPGLSRETAPVGLEHVLPSQLVGKRKICGTLRGYDQFMNLVIDEATELISLTERNPIGTVVIRGAPPERVMGSPVALCESKRS